MKKKSLKPINQLFSPGTSRIGKQVSFLFTSIGSAITSIAVVMESQKTWIIASAVITVVGALIGNLMKKDEELDDI
jgi:ABC-type iron transport system FetAB permease component